MTIKTATALVVLGLIFATLAALTWLKYFAGAFSAREQPSVLERLLFMDGQYANATKLWEDAKEQNFSYEERIRKQYVPRDPIDPYKRMRFTGTIEHAKPGLVLIQPEEGPVVISTQTLVGSTTLQRGQCVSFELTFSAKGPFAEHLQFA